MVDELKYSNEPPREIAYYWVRSPFWEEQIGEIVLDHGALYVRVPKGTQGGPAFCPVKWAINNDIEFSGPIPRPR
ncbi:MAG: hypothetical protein HQK55_07970 [Deltaproteobacteria bacterium]|nr:hypothetical protein [Deltaproteobacteria bacterium]